MSHYCPQCGAPLENGAGKCQYCGTAAPAPAQTPPPNTAGTQQQVYPQPPYQQPYQQPPYPPQPVYPQQPYQQPCGFDPGINPAWPVKSKAVAGVLALLLGGLGIHQFYLGRTGAGIVMLLFCWTYIPSIIGFIQGLVILCSNDRNFQIKYRCRLH